jgi:hypothetical protein
MADGSPITDYTLPVGACYGWRTKDGDTWETQYYKNVYDPVTHTMNYTEHTSPTCADKPKESYAMIGETLVKHPYAMKCDKCVELCGGGWCDHNYAGTLDGRGLSLAYNRPHV